MNDTPEARNWIEALRSGHYSQAQGVLRETRAQSNFFSCLGVLENIIDPSRWVSEPENYINNVNIAYFVLDAGGSIRRSTLTLTTAKHLGISPKGHFLIDDLPDDLKQQIMDILGDVDDDDSLVVALRSTNIGTRTYLAILNDHGAPFTLIADILEFSLDNPEANIFFPYSE